VFVGLPSFRCDIAGEVEPRDSVRRADELWMCNGAEGLANIGGVGNIAVGRCEDCSETGSVGKITKIGVG
jgi:hypothetical protein